MKGRMLVGLSLSSLFFLVGGDAKSRDTREKPVWTLEFIKVRPERYGSAVSHLDDQWMRIREEAKHQRAVLSYQRISNAGLLTPGRKLTDPISIVLMTEYASGTTYLEREKLFASIREHLPSNTPPGMLKLQPEDHFETDEHLFLEVPAGGSLDHLRNEHSDGAWSAPTQHLDPRAKPRNEARRSRGGNRFRCCVYAHPVNGHSALWRKPI